MNSRQRFIETMKSGHPDHVPLFEEGIREPVLDLWKSQGHVNGISLGELFKYDQRVEISLDLRPRFDLLSVRKERNYLEILHQKYKTDCEAGMPDGWLSSISNWQKRDYVLMLMVHWGFFQSLGVEDWKTFHDVIYLAIDYPEFVRSVFKIQGEYAAHLTNLILQDVEVDAIVFSEPIGGNHGALISPKMYRDYCKASYQPILDVIDRYKTDVLIWRTYANTRSLLPIILDMGINTLWACECNPYAMNYLNIREEYGLELGLIGGIDLDVIRQGKSAINQELLMNVQPLLEQGKYIPLADGRIREDIPFENYLYYRQLLEAMVLNFSD